MVLAVVSPLAYGICVAVAGAVCAAACVLARVRPGRWQSAFAALLAIVLVGDAVSFVVPHVVSGRFQASQDLFVDLCDAAVLVAAAALWTNAPLLVELTWFWGLAGTLQAVITPDVASSFPHLAFFQYLVGHLGIVTAALYLVLGVRVVPRQGSVRRVYLITLGYTAVVGLVDAVTGGDYMFLRSPPPEWTLLRILGPWPWYIASAAAVALVLLLLLDSPFGLSRASALSRLNPPTGRVDRSTWLRPRRPLTSATPPTSASP